jgi:Inner centromere protein, ARK binding region
LFFFQSKKIAAFQQQPTEAPVGKQAFGSSAHANTKTMNDRMQAMQAKRRIELEQKKGPLASIPMLAQKPHPLTDAKTNPLTSHSLTSPVQLAKPKSSLLLTKQLTGLAIAGKSTPARAADTNEIATYEMTDVEEYDSGDDCSSHRENKPIPAWAKSANLIKALERQYSPSQHVDLDEIFGEVFTCDLEAIFGRKLSRYKRRNSSGDWSAHVVTEHEKRAYKLAIK